jgi:hypothetical protein
MWTIMDNIASKINSIISPIVQLYNDEKYDEALDKINAELMKEDLPLPLLMDLHLAKGQIYQVLKDYEEAIKQIKIAENYNYIAFSKNIITEEEYQNKNLEHDFAYKLAKISLQNPILSDLNISTIETPIKILANKTVSNIDTKDIISIYFQIQKEWWIQKIFEAYALHSLESEDKNLLVMMNELTLTNDGKEGQSDGFFYEKADRLVIAALSPNVASTLTHEMTHAVLKYIFNNVSNPYNVDNTNIQNVLSEYERNVLLNMEEILLGHRSLNSASLPNYEIGKIIFQKFKDPSYDFNKFTTNQLKIINSVLIIYDSATYDEESVHRELVVLPNHYRVQDLTQEELAPIKPLFDFMDLYVLPEVERFINEHPLRNRLADMCDSESIIDEVSSDICLTGEVSLT